MNVFTHSGGKRCVSVCTLAVAAFIWIFSSGCDNSDHGASNWTMIWVEEFDGDSLDAVRWEYQTGDGCPNMCGWGNNELQYYQEENARVENGMLVITARPESVGGRDYTSARIRTRNLGDWLYGRFEIRARLPEGQGIWPAIWMLPTANTYGGWAASGEIDIMEMVGHEPQTVHGTIHHGGQWPDNIQTGTSHALGEGTFADGFHVFSLEWEERELRWFVDGQLYHSLDNWSSSGGEFPAPFNRPFHLLINLAVGGNWPGVPDSTTVFPQHLEVDYVRVYQKNP